MATDGNTERAATANLALGGGVAGAGNGPTGSKLKLKVTIEEGESGMWFATSEGERGMFLATTQLETLMKILPDAIRGIIKYREASPRT